MGRGEEQRCWILQSNQEPDACRCGTRTADLGGCDERLSKELRGFFWRDSGVSRLSAFLSFSFALFSLLGFCYLVLCRFLSKVTQNCGIFSGLQMAFFSFFGGGG